MGLARELSMGTRRPRTRIASTGPYAVMRRLTAITDLTDRQADELRAVILAVGASTLRLRPAEGRVYSAACARYRAHTGQPIGPETGTY